jgi:hypothetical protein
MTFPQHTIMELHVGKHDLAFSIIHATGPEQLKIKQTFIIKNTMKG